MKTVGFVFMLIVLTYFGSCSKNDSTTGPGDTGKKLTLLLPQNKSENIVRLTCLQWKAETDIVSYNLVLASDAEFKNIVLEKKDSTYWVTYGTMYYPQLLDSNKTYYWKVQGYNNNKEIAESEVWSFKTMGGYYPRGNMNVRIYGNHSCVVNGSSVTDKLISIQQNYGLGSFSNFYDNLNFYGRYYYLMNSGSSDRLLKCQFNSKHDQIISFESYQVIRNGQAPNYTTSSDTLIFKNIPFTGENDSCFVLMIRGQACSDFVKKISKRNSEYYLYNLSYNYQYLRTEWDNDSYIKIEFKK